MKNNYPFLRSRVSSWMKRGIPAFLFILLNMGASDLFAQTTLYYKGSGALNDVVNWGINPDGSGGNNGLVNFSGNNFSYIIQNTTGIVFNAGIWLIAGDGTKAYLGNPTTPSAPISLTIAAGSTIDASGQKFDVPVASSGNHKIIYQNTTAISVGTVDPNLELVYDGAKITTTTTRVYGNVSLKNGAEISFAGAAGPTFNNFTIDEGCKFIAALGGSANYIAIKSGGIVTINGYIEVGRTGGLFTANVPPPITTSNSYASLLFASSTVTQGVNLFIGPKSTVEYSRGTSGQTAIQTIQALDYANLILSNTSSSSGKAFAAGNHTVSGTFTIGLIGAATITAPTTQNITLLPNAKLVINSATTFPTPTGGGKFILESGPAGTASIGTLASGAKIEGNVTIRQYIPGGSRRYRFLGNPIKTPLSLSQFTDEIDITGNPNGTTGLAGQTPGTGFTATTTNNPSAYYFSTADANGDATNDAGWKAFTNATDLSWNKGQGIRVLIRGTKGQAGTLDGTEATPAPVTLELVGEVNTGDISIPIVTGGTGSTAGYNLVGNPYPSPVDIGAVLSAAGPNVGNAFYLRNPQTGSYITVSPIPATYMIPANSAFFVKANIASSLNFTELHKKDCGGCPQVFDVPGSSLLQIDISKGGTENDNLSVRIHKSYENGKDGKDAEKLMNDGLSLYTLSSDNAKLAVNYLNEDIGSVRVGINLPKAGGPQQYQVKVSKLVFPDGLKLTLVDKYTNIKTVLEEGKTFMLSVDPNDKTQTGEDRLVLLLSR